MKHLAAVLVAMLAGCAGIAPPPFLQGNSRPVVAACPPEVAGQAVWVQKNLTRTRLGAPRSEAVAVLGLPAHVESFLLADNSAVDVLFYHTPDTACRPASAAMRAGLLPLVFQNDRLLGYGQGYYHTMVVPSVRQPLGVPATPAPPDVPAASVGRGQPLR